LKRAHSAEPDATATNATTASTGTLSRGNDIIAADPGTASTPDSTSASNAFSTSLPADSVVGSPLKKHRPSINITGDALQLSLPGSLGAGIDEGNEKLPAKEVTSPSNTKQTGGDDDEEL
jgi:hypothetical protein